MLFQSFFIDLTQRFDADNICVLHQYDLNFMEFMMFTR